MPATTYSAAAAFAAVTLATLAVSPVAGQQPALTSDLPASGFIAGTRAIHLKSAAPLGDAQRVVVFVDDTDVSALLETSASAWRYDAAMLPIESGVHELIAWIVESDTTWHEALRTTFTVPGTLGIAEADVKPTLELGVKSRLASAFEPAVPGERATYNDFDGRFGVATEVTHYGGTRFGTRAQVIGNSERNRALRYRELEDDAPLVDLSSYVAEVKHRGVQLAVGNLAAGSARHLIQGFNSRGAGLSLAGGSRVQVTANALHGSDLVGWSDPVGIGEPDHRILTGSIGIEALRQAGALRIEMTALDGSILPRSGFGRAAVTDAETSTGYAFRVQSQALDRRVRVEAGFTSSTFDNPDDPALAQDTVLVAVERETRAARFVQTSLEVLRAVGIGSGRTVSLTAGFAHERVDPLFRTVAAYTRADQLQNRWELRGDLAGLTVTANHARSHNNLDELESLLTSHTRRTGVDAALPLGSIMRAQSWLPTLRWRTDRTHQFGAHVPVNGGFSESHVPDQVSTDRSLGADMRLSFASVGYRHDRSIQDNRQVDRENADLERATHSVRATVTPIRALSASVDVAFTEAVSLERDETDTTRRIGATLNWMPLRESVLGLQLSSARAENDVRDSTRDDLTWSVQWASPVPGLDRFGGKLLLRFARAENTARESDTELRRANWMVDAGFNLSLR